MNGSLMGEVAVRVYFADTDAGGVCYYGRYLEYMERSRAELLRALGVDQVTFSAESNRAFIVRQLEAHYLAPARLDDALIVRTQVNQARRSDVHLTQEIFLEGNDDPIFRARIQLVCVNATTLRPAATPTELLAAITALIPASA